MMRRFRIFGFSFDSRVLSLTTEEQEQWDDAARELHRQNRQQVVDALVSEFGADAADEKRRNFIDLGAKALSIYAFHNRFLSQVRTAFVMGSYYPSLTGACALGERILNHLVLLLREDFKATPDYKRIYRKESFDNWDLAIDTLENWEVLLPNVAAEFRKLRNRRNDAIHFRPEVDRNDRELALEAIRALEAILSEQFSAFGPQPWFIKDIPGEIYIKKDWEKRPFIREVYLPNCVAVGPDHRILSVMPWQIEDRQYEPIEVTDEEFSRLRRKANAQHVAPKSKTPRSKRSRMK